MDIGVWQQFGLSISEAFYTVESTGGDPIKLVIEWMSDNQIEEVKRLLNTALESFSDKRIEEYWGESMADFGVDNTRAFFKQLLDSINTAKV